MNIAVASGKGGAGKTTISLSLAVYLAEKGKRVTVIDCDVEEPNVNLFLKSPIRDQEKIRVPVPSVNGSACNGCGSCEDICAFNAIVLIGGRPLVLADLCHSCGGCVRICPSGAISEAARDIGIIESGAVNGINYSGGRLNVGEHMSPPLIREVRKKHQDAEMIVTDCPPGASCPVIASVRGADFLLLAAEPTPFGLNDLRLAVDMARAMRLRFGVVINRDGIGNHDLERWCVSSGVEVLARIPESRRIAEEYSRGDCVSFMLRNFSGEIARILELIEA